MTAEGRPLIHALQAVLLALALFAFLLAYAAPRPAPAAAPAATLPAPARLIAEAEGMTPDQRDAYLASLVGSYVNGWRGTVCDLRGTATHLHVYVSLDGGCANVARFMIDGAQAASWYIGQEARLAGVVAAAHATVGGMEIVIGKVGQ